jgi:hypothetical protein
MQIPQPTILRPCPVCHLVFICETCTLPPSHECELYQQIGSIEMFKIKHFGDSGQAWCRAPTGTPRSSFRALSTANNWHEYFSEISDKKYLVESTGSPLKFCATRLLKEAWHWEIAAVWNLWPPEQQESKNRRSYTHKTTGKYNGFPRSHLVINNYTDSQSASQPSTAQPSPQA